MTEEIPANLSEKDWQNLRNQLRTLVDIYCDLNDDVFKIKDLLKNMVKTMCTQAKESKEPRKKVFKI